MRSGRIVAGVLFIFIVGLAGAAETFIDVHDFGKEGVLWDFESERLPDHRSADWMHTTSGFDGSCTVTEATLTIQGQGIHNIYRDFDGDGGKEPMDHVSVEFMGHDLGPLKGDITIFNLKPYQNLLSSAAQTSATIAFQNDPITITGRRGASELDLDWKDMVFLKRSTLVIGFEPVAPPIPPLTVPAPSAILLAGIGTLIVGFLRKRRIS